MGFFRRDRHKQAESVQNGPSPALAAFGGSPGNLARKRRCDFTPPVTSHRLVASPFPWPFVWVSLGLSHSLGRSARQLAHVLTLHHGAWASLAAPAMVGRLLGHREGLRQKPRSPSGPFLVCSVSGTFLVPPWRVSFRSCRSVDDSVRKGFLLPDPRPRHPEIRREMASVKCCL